MSSQVIFKNKWLPYALIAPQLVITIVFFIWPAGQAVFQSSQLEDAFGISREFVGLENFSKLLSDSYYLDSFFTTIQFSVCVAVLALVSALILSAFAEHIVRGATMYRTFFDLAICRRPCRGRFTLAVSFLTRRLGLSQMYSNGLAFNGTLLLTALMRCGWSSSPLHGNRSVTTSCFF